MKKLSTSGAFIQWSMLLWLLPFECLLLSVWLRLGVFVTFAYINMCTSRVFVMKLPLPGDIRLYLRMKNLSTSVDGSNLLMVVFILFTSQKKVSVQELPWHFRQNKFSCSMSSNGLCDQHHMTAILCLCDCVWGSLWHLLTLTCAHWGSSWSSCHYQMIYDS